MISRLYQWFLFMHNLLCSSTGGNNQFQSISGMVADLLDNRAPAALRSMTDPWSFAYE